MPTGNFEFNFVSDCHTAYTTNSIRNYDTNENEIFLGDLPSPQRLTELVQLEFNYVSMLQIQESVLYDLLDAALESMYQTLCDKKFLSAAALDSYLRGLTNVREINPTGCLRWAVSTLTPTDDKVYLMVRYTYQVSDKNGGFSARNISRMHHDFIELFPEGVDIDVRIERILNDDE